MPSIALFVTWKQLGFYILLYLAALQNVARELYEAASTDGASRWQSFFNVTVPAVRPATVLVLLLSTITGANLFTEPYLLTGGGGPNGASTLAGAGHVPAGHRAGPARLRGRDRRRAGDRDARPVATCPEPLRRRRRALMATRLAGARGPPSCARARPGDRGARLPLPLLLHGHRLAAARARPRPWPGPSRTRATSRSSNYVTIDARINLLRSVAQLRDLHRRRDRLHGRLRRAGRLRARRAAVARPRRGRSRSRCWCRWCRSSC